MTYTVHVMISGIVQGVWFRASTKRQADLLGITGWIRNTDDGRVEGIFEGEKESVEKLVEWCHTGPPLSRVKKVVVIPMSTKVGCPTFAIKR